MGGSRSPGADRNDVRRASGIVYPPPAEEVEEEFAFHVEMRTRELERQGVGRAEARAVALKGFGRMSEVKAVCTRLGEQRNRRENLRMVIGGFLRDVRHAVRQMGRTPVLTIAAVLTLALGIGATTAVFSVINGVLLSPLPFPSPDRIVEIRTRYLPPSGFDIARFPISRAELFDYRAASESFERLGIYSTGMRTLAVGDAEPARLPTVFLDRAALEVLAVVPALGRWFTTAEDLPDVSIGLLGYELWRTRFGADSSIIGTTIPVSGRSFVVTGIMPPGFAFPDSRFQIFENIGIDPADPGGRAAHGEVGIGRLRPGVDLDRAEAESRTIAARWAELYPHNVAHFPIFERLTDNLVGTDVRRTLLVLLLAVVIVLLIAAANVANLLMARGENRQVEIAIRASMGATRSRIVRQLLTESLTLAVAGSALGVVLGGIGLRALLRIDPGALPRPEQIELNSTVMAVAALITLGTSVLFGLAPALQAGRISASGLGARGSSPGVSSRRFRRSLVAAEVGLSLVVVVAAGLVVRSFDEMIGIDPGVSMDAGLTFPLLLESDRYPEPGTITAFHRSLKERLEGLPGVRSATAVSHAPLSGSGSRNDFVIEGRAARSGDEPALSAQWTSVLPGYFETMALPTIRGRLLQQSDGEGAEPVVVVGQSLVEEYFADQDPLDARIGVARDSIAWARIVGVVPDSRTNSLDSEVIPQVYFSIAQAPRIAWPMRFMNIVLKSDTDAAGLSAAVRNAVRELDPQLPISDIRTLEQVRDASVARLRLVRDLLGLFGLIALALATIGIYGVVSFAVSRRTREIGIRMALGAGRLGLVRLMLREGAVPAVVGVVIAVPVALLATGILSGILFRVSPRDPGVFIAVSAGLLAVALASSWVPARRATRLAPTEALRSD